MSRFVALPDVLADEFRGIKGVQVEVYSGAGSRGSTDFGPIGIMNHHTGPGAYDNLLRYMATGSSIAPLCNWATSRPNSSRVVRVTVVATGRANHAGKGGSGLGGTPWIPTNQGNKLTVGGEHQNDGREAWPEQQLEVIAQASAAILAALRQDEGRAALHKTYAAGRKPDMHTVSLSQHQAHIRRYRLGGAPPPTPAQPPTEEDTMRLVRNSLPTNTAQNPLYGRIALIGGPRKPFEHITDPNEAGALSAALGNAKDINAVEFARTEAFLNRGVA